MVIDHSGSMGERCAGGRRPTKHNEIIRAFQGIASGIGLSDAVEVWEFSDSFNCVGSTKDNKDLRAIAQRLQKPAGGTDIGRALEGVLAQSNARDLLLVTDGKSHEIDVQSLASSGRRISVVLVGEDSLEANVGHLAALTGVKIIFASENDLANILGQYLRWLHNGHLPSCPIIGLLHRLTSRHAVMSITVSWHSPDGPLAAILETRANKKQFDRRMMRLNAWWG